MSKVIIVLEDVCETPASPKKLHVEYELIGVGDKDSAAMTIAKKVISLINTERRKLRKAPNVRTKKDA